MGLFSFGNKNKQETVRDSGHFVKDDDAAYTERARSKRAGSAGEGARRTGRGDPILPEKKRARRRLVGAIALALAAVVALPMLFDHEPKPLATDIAIHIPDKDKAPPLPVPSEQVAPAASVDSDEEIVEAPPAPPAATRSPEVSVAPAADPARSAATGPAAPRVPEADRPAAPPKPEASPETVKPARPEPKPEPKPEPEKKPARAADLHPKAEQAARPARADDAARAMAILEGKAAAPAPARAEGPAPRYVVQVAALASQEKVGELQERLRAAGIASFTQKSGDLIRVRIGPMSREEAEKVRARLGGIGLSGSMVPL